MSAPKTEQALANPKIKIRFSFGKWSMLRVNRFLFTAFGWP